MTTSDILLIFIRCCESQQHDHIPLGVKGATIAGLTREEHLCSKSSTGQPSLAVISAPDALTTRIGGLEHTQTLNLSYALYCHA